MPFIQSLLVATTERAPPRARCPSGSSAATSTTRRRATSCSPPTAAAVARALARLAERGIARAVVQEHVAGDLIKFYGDRRRRRPRIGEPPWFQWFYHRDQTLWPDTLRRARARAARAPAAAALGLEVYGGDAIATATGELVLIDLNAWPSFALYRDVAAAAIAAYLAAALLGSDGAR